MKTRIGKTVVESEKFERHFQTSSR